ncbi:MAG TPA: OPT family oligopeptide transporter [Byssovorax sp.]|jgi:OPT family oligopeptide transporter
MTIKQLTPEQVQSMTLEEKDRWWLENVYRGDMPQLTLRSGLTGMFLGGFLSLTNLYIGAHTGWSLGVGITSVILSFALFKLMARLKIANAMTVLENNAMQSIATSAGYTNSALYTSFAAYTMVTNRIVPMYQAIVWMLVLTCLGVFFAFPMKKRFINDEQLPFPEGMAAGVVMDALHGSDEKDGLFKAKLLVVGGSLSGLLELVRSDKLMRFFFAVKNVPNYYDEYLYDGWFADWLKRHDIFPGISWGGKPVLFKELTLRWDTSVVLLATGGIMGIRAGVSMLIGGLLNYAVLAPYFIGQGVIRPNAAGHYGFRQITIWALWGGVACMTTSSLYSFFSKPKVILDSVRGLFKRGQKAKVDVLEGIELPIKVSLIGAPIAAVILVVLGHAWFGISYVLGALAVPLVFFFALIAVNATGLTSITPSGALGKLTQLTFGALAPNNITTNLMTASITAETSLNTANLLMDIKPGYMLGAKPRQQAVGHVLGAIAGASVGVPVWYLLIHGDLSLYGSEKFPMPSALAWRAVAELLMHGLDNLEKSAQYAVVVGAIIGLIVEVSKQVTKNKFPLSAIGLGLAFVLNFVDIWSMFLGSFIFWMFERKAHAWKNAETSRVERAEADKEYRKQPDESGAKKPPWYAVAADNTEAICAGVIAGGALMGIGVNVLDVLVLPDVTPLASFGKVAAEVMKHAAAVH